MARFILLTFLFLCSTVAAFAQSQASLQGVVTDDKGELVMFANVAIYRNGALITGTQTDIDGKYSFSPIDPGTYDLEVSFVGMTTKKVTGVVVLAGKAITLNVEMTVGITVTEVEVVGYKVPLIEQDNTTQGQVVTSEEIAKLPSKNINGIIAQSAGVSSADEGDAVSIRGSRSASTDYYIDGIRVRGSLPPQTEIEQLQVITGGIPANIGDITGGVISITTKGPSRDFSGYAEVETSKYLDAFDYRLANVSLTGPILKDKKGNSVIGYRVSGQYLYLGDRDPSAVGVYRVKEDVFQRLTEDPLVQIFTGNELNAVPAAQYLTEDDVDLVKARPNSSSTRYDFTGKLDFRLSNSMDITIGGNYNYRADQAITNSLLNYSNNRTDISSDWRGYFRFRHRIGGSSKDAEKEKAKTGASIENASYSLQFSYDYSTRVREDPRHQDRLFDYGYIGQFQHAEIPQQGAIIDTSGNVSFRHIGNFYTATDYIPSTINASLANYNKFIEDFDQITDFPFFNGNRPDALMSVYNLHTNVNDIYNLTDKFENNQYQFNANGSFEIVPRGSDAGKHTIEFGLYYEQREDRYYAINPRRLWILARQYANNHFNGLDTSNVIGQFTAFDGTLIDQYANLPQTFEQAYFDKNLRTALGAGAAQWIDVDMLTPDQLKLEYFSADELFNQGDELVSYYGYDYLGNELGGNVSFNDFFTQKDANSGEYLRNIAPNRPIYTAGYIQDKFLFKDIIFRVGVRVDRYDANTKTLKDPYVLYETYTAAEVASAGGVTLPGTIGDDFVAYTANGDLTGEIKGYRTGNDWYDANGTPVNSPINLFGAEQAIPVLRDQNADIKSANYDPNTSFKDVEPTVTVMPRLAFSFPISEEANFFAHYDVLTMRPPSNTLTRPVDFYYFAQNIRGGVFNNPSLRPERTVDYEVGFQQKLSDASALKVSAYYKELRDMIQAQTYLYAYPGNYEGYGNQDFGTVKGFNFTYDMRRTGNISLRATYTLQFADGTGSDANSQRGLTSRGNLRSIYPLSFDERHRLTGTIDFRYFKGNAYNGPTINGKQILADVGINLTLITASGRPYTASLIPQPFGGSGTKGSLNGARSPWNTTLNLRIDKDFTVIAPKEGKSGLSMNVYFRVQNLLNQLNVLGLYSFTGSPDDDGYLASQQGQAFLLQQADIQSFLLSYQWRLLQPDFYSLPRRMYVGAIFNF